MAADYREIAATLRKEIASGDHRRGGAFPTGPEIADRFKVSEGTANLSMGLLRSEGLIFTKRGRGTVVNPVPVLTREVVARQRRTFRESGGARGAFDSELRLAGLEPRTKTAPGREIPPTAVAVALGIAEGEDAVLRRRIMSAAGRSGERPIQLATSWLPVALAGDTAIEQRDTGPGGIYSRLAELGHGPAEFTEELLVRTPDEAEAETLDLDSDHRVFEITRTAIDAQGQIVEVNLMTLPAHQWKIVFRWAAED